MACRRQGLADQQSEQRHHEHAGDAQPREEQEAKAKLNKKDALALSSRASTIRIAKGKKVLSYDMKKDPPDGDELLRGMLGPTGNLRAPTIIKGKSLIVGFEKELYKKVLGK